MEVTGILVKKVGERSGVSKTTGNPWKTGEYLVEIPGQYPKRINFQVNDGNVGRLSRFDSLIGKMVTVSFDIDAHEHEGRWFNEIKAWGVFEYIDQTTREANIAAAQSQEREQGCDAAAEPLPTENSGEDKGDDLPF